MNTVTIVCGASLVACLLIAAVALGLAGWETGAILGLLAGVLGIATPVLALLDKVTNVQRETGEQSHALGTISRRVNGELDARLDAAADRAASKAVAAALNAPTASLAVVVPHQREPIDTGTTAA